MSEDRNGQNEDGDRDGSTSADFQSGAEAEVRGTSGETVSQEPAEAPSETDLLVDAWWTDNMPGSVLGQNTIAYNHVYSALADLKRRLSTR